MGALAFVAQRQLAAFERTAADSPLPGARRSEGAMTVDRDGKVLPAGLDPRAPVKVGDRGAYVASLRHVPPGPYTAWVWAPARPGAPVVVQAARTPEGRWLPSAAAAWAPGLAEAPFPR